ncbi:DUF4189 domain-containing protein [Nocardia huaxiensis]|uniref:DUF4189 domain-containing protein n=1 Tax=Nocardia huaxiensis TaxID=2755382 RepID=A0A7D6V6P8_9NOCA|nr:DUF4189 domain-containing protein [Nocardia huaxiensis]QLY28932.1 DUF4189 domain-containing protein [Nocardia huaxiensis]UFS97593.1 DUF4189 domain-containing protein [Nocardia huaxiensis]
MSLLRKAGMGLAVTSMAAMGAVSAGPAGAAEEGPVFEIAGGDLYGAIAVSRSTFHVAYAVDYTNSGGADAAAIDSCGGGDCYAIVNFANACGAVSQSSDGRFGAGWAGTKVEAEKAAIDNLKGNGKGLDLGSSQGNTGRVIMSTCTSNAR